MGRQGFAVAAIIVVGSALFAATRRDVPSMVISALGLPLLMVALLQVLSRFGSGGRRSQTRRPVSGQEPDLLTLLARTNPFMFLLMGLLTRRNDVRFRELLAAGPYGLGGAGYLILLVIALAPLLLALLITIITRGALG
jgi:hypothetical protein